MAGHHLWVVTSYFYYFESSLKVIMWPPLTQSERVLPVSTVGPDLPEINVTPFSITERGYSALERETVSLLCQAQSNPASQYVWFYNNSQVYTGPQFTITKILRMHTGDYACLAQNTYLNTRSKKTISLTVYCEYTLDWLPSIASLWTCPHLLSVSLLQSAKWLKKWDKIFFHLTFSWMHHLSPLAYLTPCITSVVNFKHSNMATRIHRTENGNAAAQFFCSDHSEIWWDPHAGT